MTILMPGFTLIERLWSDPKAAFYHARRESDQQDVMLKIFKDESLLTKAIVENEKRILSHLSINSVLKSLGWDAVDDYQILVFEYFPSKLLSTLMTEHLSIREKIEIAIALAQGLGEIHHQNIIHKDIKPSNILVSQKNRVKFFNFVYASSRNREIQSLSQVDSLQGTLAYMSPEQTGRINRPLNYRTDIYSFGVTLYQLFTNKLPFEETDPMELVYMHIAKEPAPPHVVNPEIPESISKVIMKCLMKDSEERYHSALGIKNDFQEILLYFETKKVLSNFTPGLRDVYDQFQIPRKLYGRETELDHLRHILNQASHGRSELLLVSGYAGIGKSSLVYALEKEIVNSKGYFIVGKFDQSTIRQPFSGLIQALQHLVNQLLTESDNRVGMWRDEILDALKVNASLMTDYLPELKLIIGEQPPLENLSPFETENRLFYSFSQFIKVFTRQKRPLLLVLDDLQWADPFSLKFLENLFLTEMKHCLVIGTYRSNEVLEDHPLAKCLKRIEEKSGPITNLEVKPLLISAINTIVAETLHSTLKSASTMAHQVQKKTLGNPFFINQYLKMLYQEELIEFDPKSQIWLAKVDQIEKTHVTDNVVDMMTIKIKTLSQLGQKALMIASAMGYSFNIAALAKVLNFSKEETLSALSEAVDEEFVIPSSHSNRKGEEFVFQHDRIQQVAYQLIPHQERDPLHYAIGKALLDTVSEEHFDEKVLNIVNHLNRGLHLNATDSEKKELMRVNFLAGKRTKQAGFYSSAIHFFKTSIELLETNHWKNQYDLSYELYKSLAVCQQVNGDVKEANETFDLLISNAATDVEKAKIYLEKITLFYGKASTFKPIFDLGKRALNLVGVPFEENPSKLSSFYTRLKLRQYAYFINPLKVAKLPVCEDEKVILIGRIYARLFYYALYSGNRKLMESLSQKLVALLLKHGLTDSGTYGLSCFTMMILGIGVDYQTVFKFAKLTLDIANRFGTSGGSFDAVYPIYSQTNRCGEHIGKGVEPLLSLGRLQQESGNFRTAALSSSTAIRISLMKGDSINLTLDLINQFLGEIDPRKTFSEYWYLQIARCFCLALKDEIKKECCPPELNQAFFESLPAGTREHLEMKLFWHQMILDYVHEDFEKIDNYVKIFEAIPAYWPYKDDFYYYYALSLAARGKDKKKIKSIQKLFKKWAQASPANYAHRNALLLAEIARLEASHDRAVDFYEQAIDQARKNGYQQDLALAYELLANCHLESLRTERSVYPLEQAMENYLKWGAISKVKKLDEKHSALLVGRSKITQGNSSEGKPVGEIDLNTLINATQTISREVSLDKLIEVVMRIIAINTGADKALLILEKNKQLMVVSELLQGQEHPSHLHDVPIESRSEQMSLSIVNYVLRSQKEVLLNDALREGGFEKDPYILSQKPLSVLCIPISQQGKFTGLLYLENHLSKGIFTKDRIRLLSILSAQIAISIENSVFYAELEDKVKSRTQDLQEALNRLNTMQAELITQEKLKEREIMKHKFGKYVPNPKVFEDILERGLPLGGEEKEVSILFCDIRNFTTLSEIMTPKQIVEILNRYFTRVVSIVNKNHGIVDKFIGDAFMAIFGALDSEQNHAQFAVKAAIEIQQVLEKYNRKRPEGVPIIRVGAGINTGKVLMGNIGSEERLEYTAIGDNVNVASRIEGLTKTMDCSILITESTYRYLDSSFLVESKGNVQVKGKAKEVKIYSVTVPKLTE